MSLSQKEIEITARELQKNFELLGYTKARVAKDLNIEIDYLDKLLVIDKHVNPANVWMLRDYLEEKLIRNGQEPFPFTVLKTNVYYPYKKPWKNY